MDEKIRLGISSCLLGHPVRFDGGHKQDRFITDTLGKYVDFVPVCPEVEMGLPTPREALRLVGEPEQPRLVTARSGKDYTEAMLAWTRRKVAALEREGLCGFIFKSKSPSSGMERVKLYDRNGVPRNVAVGLFAREFMAHFPCLPVEEEGRLHDPHLRENFIESIFAMQRWRTYLQDDASVGGLVTFHARHKLLLMSHSPELYRQLGRLVAQAKDHTPQTLRSEYQGGFMRAMRLLPTIKKHVNVLHHLLGYFKKNLSADEKQELLEVIDHYAQGHIPLIVPVTLLNHFVRKFEQAYLQQQFYLTPSPLELKLRNHA